MLKRIVLLFNISIKVVYLHSNTETNNNLKNNIMKAKVTKLAVKQSYNTILSLGYCDVQYLTYYQRTFGYSCGVYGWSCDYYDIDGVCLSTGYNPIGENVDYNLMRKFEAKAQKIVTDYNIKYDLKVKKVNKLLTEFINLSKQ